MDLNRGRPEKEKRTIATVRPRPASAAPAGKVVTKEVNHR
jgi:hypothetical protein